MNFLELQVLSLHASFFSLCFNGLGRWLPKFSEHGDFLSDALKVVGVQKLPSHWDPPVEVTALHRLAKVVPQRSMKL